MFARKADIEILTDQRSVELASKSPKDGKKGTRDYPTKLSEKGFKDMVTAVNEQCADRYRRAAQRHR
eukprot:6184495-Pleurochrysis_carterae.AAC.2